MPQKITYQKNTKMYKAGIPPSPLVSLVENGLKLPDSLITWNFRTNEIIILFGFPVYKYRLRTDI